MAFSIAAVTSDLERIFVVCEVVVMEVAADNTLLLPLIEADACARAVAIFAMTLPSPELSALCELVTLDPELPMRLVASPFNPSNLLRKIVRIAGELINSADSLSDNE